MKVTSLFVTMGLGLFLLPSPRAHAQAREEQQPPSAGTSSWLFLLETKTQWLMVLQDHAGSQGASSSKTPESTSPGGSGNTGNQNTGNNPGQSGGSQGKVGNTQFGNTPRANNAPDQAVPVAAQGENGVDKGADTSEGVVFEGNTDDIPLDTAPEKPSSGGSPKPSGPSS